MPAAITTATIANARKPSSRNSPVNSCRIARILRHARDGVRMVTLQSAVR
jgi:hypothetical protein